MAVTQQLVRIDDERIDGYRSSENALIKLLEFESEPPCCYVDLDWSPNGLVLAIEQMLGSKIAENIDLVLSDNSEILNRRYPEGPKNDIVYSKVTFVQPNEYEEVVAPLFSISGQSIAKKVLEVYKGSELAENTDPLSYYSNHYRMLCDFLLAASKNDQYIISWWD